jgi:hypothetical protein
MTGHWVDRNNTVHCIDWLLPDRPGRRSMGLLGARNTPYHRSDLFPTDGVVHDLWSGIRYVLFPGGTQIRKSFAIK